LGYEPVKTRIMEYKIKEIELYVKAGEHITDAKLKAVNAGYEHKSDVFFFHNEKKYTITFDEIQAFLNLIKYEELFD